MLIFSYLIGLIALLWSVLAMVRLLAQKGGLNFTHPLAGFLYKSTQWLVGPLRSICRPYKGWDSAIIVAVFLCFFIARLIIVGVELARSQIDLNLTVLLVVNVLMILLSVAKAFIYAVWLILITLYFMRSNRAERELRHVFTTVIARIAHALRLLRAPQLSLFVLASLWLFIVDPYLTLVLQNQIYY